VYKRQRGLGDVYKRQGFKSRIRNKIQIKNASLTEPKFG
jgi:hypothetical protein